MNIKIYFDFDIFLSNKAKNILKNNSYEDISNMNYYNIIDNIFDSNYIEISNIESYLNQLNNLKNEPELIVISKYDFRKIRYILFKIDYLLYFTDVINNNSYLIKECDNKNNTIYVSTNIFRIFTNVWYVFSKNINENTMKRILNKYNYINSKFSQPDQYIF